MRRKPSASQAQTWQAAVGAQSVDKAKQVVAFLPNEIWIHAGDTINWTVAADEIHTISFLTLGQVRLPFSVGCPGFSVGAASFDGSTCVSTPPMVSGQTFSVMFPSPGNFKLVCLVHPDMTGVVHVLDPSAPSRMISPFMIKSPLTRPMTSWQTWIMFRATITRVHPTVSSWEPERL